jgi:hypothetical protein
MMGLLGLCCAALLIHVVSPNPVLIDDNFCADEICRLSGFAGKPPRVRNEATNSLDLFHEMQVFLRAIDRRHIAIEVAHDESINLLKEKVAKLVGIPADQQILSYAGKVLQTGTILDYSVQKDCTITLALALPGGVLA